MKIAAIILLVLGALGHLYGVSRNTARETERDIGPVHATAEREPTVPIAPKVLTGGGDDAPADARGPGGGR